MPANGSVVFTNRFRRGVGTMFKLGGGEDPIQGRRHEVLTMGDGFSCVKPNYPKFQFIIGFGSLYFEKY